MKMIIQNIKIYQTQIRKCLEASALNFLISKSPCIIAAKFFAHAHLSAWNFLSYLIEFQTAIQVQFNCHLI